MFGCESTEKQTTMATGSAFGGALWNLVRFVFLLLLVVLVLLFILAKGGGNGGEGDPPAAEPEIVYKVIEGELGSGWTDLKYRLKYRWEGRTLDYELMVHPYDDRLERLRGVGHELILLSFVDEEGQRVVPASAPERIEFRQLEPVMAEAGENGPRAIGWSCRSRLSREAATGGAISDAEMGWLFSEEMLGMLRKLRRERLHREQPRQSRDASTGPRPQSGGRST